MADPIRVLIADDQELIRSGFKAILSAYPDLEVVGAAADGRQAVELAQQLRPDVVLMDIRMPQLDGISATRDITGNPTLAKTHVLVLTTFDLDQYVYDALEAGASGFLLKDADPDEMVRAVRVVAAGDALIQPSVMRRLVQDFAAQGKRRAGSAEQQQRVDDLTDREREILVLVARGLSNDQIGQELFISPATVKTHIARIMGKTDAHDRAQLVVFAYEAGLV
ncbi:response regulator transcription factor [Adlercreutzia murintestinalis]|uniref:response regulator transcription factor n=1 Tax=Adlercreutzia murintestinalis TaxID=2941325 RepID=UPI00203F0F4E|nr:response regulator transcription factor [Adlercreutzia murintestinalis]